VHFNCLLCRQLPFQPYSLHPKPDRLALLDDSAKMHFGALELAWRGARDRLQGCKREDDRRKKRRRRMTTKHSSVGTAKIGPHEARIVVPQE